MSAFLPEGEVPACVPASTEEAGTELRKHSGLLTVPFPLFLPPLIRGVIEGKSNAIALIWTEAGSEGTWERAGTPPAATPARDTHRPQCHAHPRARLRAPAGEPSERLTLRPCHLRWERVSRQRTDLQRASWPFPIMPHGRGSSRQTWTGLASGIGWCLVVVEAIPTDTHPGSIGPERAGILAGAASRGVQ